VGDQPYLCPVLAQRPLETRALPRLSRVAVLFRDVGFLSGKSVPGCAVERAVRCRAARGGHRGAELLCWLQLRLLLAAWAPQSMQDELRLPQNVTGAGQALSAAHVLACYS